VERLQPGILKPEFLDMARVFLARAPELVEDVIFVVAEGPTADADAGSTKIGPVRKVLGMGGVARRRAPAQVGGDIAGRRGLEIVSRVELHGAEEVGGETAILALDHRVAADH
jgi:hypothetical protein